MKSSLSYIGALMLLVLLLIRSYEAHGKTLGKITDFNDYITILTQTLDFKQKLRIIEAVWGEIRSDYADDLDKVADLYQQLDYAIESFLQMRKELQAAEELKQELLMHLRQQQGAVIAKSWSSKAFAYARNEQLQAEIKVMLKNYDSKLLKQIYKQAIDSVYDVVEAQLLSAHIRQTFQPDFHDDIKSFEANLESQLYLLAKFSNARDVNDVFLFDIAYYLHKLHTHHFFPHLDGRMQEKFWKVVNDDLPQTLVRIFFDTEFCLLNKRYEDFLYVTNAIDIDEQRRFIFTWGVPNVVNAHGLWRMNITEISSNDRLRLEFGFKGKTSGMFMYLEPKIKDYEYLIAAWRNGSAPEHSAWHLKLQNDILIFENENKLLCASKELFDARRLVFGRYDKDNNPGTENCQWEATDCPEAKKR